MKKLIKLIEAASKLPPHVTSMFTQTVPWIAVTAMLVAVLFITARQGG